MSVAPGMMRLALAATLVLTACGGSGGKAADTSAADDSRGQGEVAGPDGEGRETDESPDADARNQTPDGGRELPGDGHLPGDVEVAGDGGEPEDGEPEDGGTGDGSPADVEADGGGDGGAEEVTGDGGAVDGGGWVDLVDAQLPDDLEAGETDEELAEDDADGSQPEEVGKDGGGCLDVYPGQVLITEIMATPQAAPPPAGWWVELYNAGQQELVMSGWELLDGEGNGASLALAGGKKFLPGGYLVVVWTGDPGSNGGVVGDLAISGLDLSSGALTIHLPATGLVVDSILWNDSWPLQTGAAMSLDPAAMGPFANDKKSAWCSASISYGDGDLGTPGAPNPDCPPPPDCGNGIVEPGEECDDGANGIADDGCTNGCTWSCQNGAADCPDLPGDCQAPVCVANDLGRVCGSQAAEDPPFGKPDCIARYCDEGIVVEEFFEDGQPCDNGGGPKGDYCLATLCIDAFCGDGIVGPLEACDDGGQLPGDGCSPGCTLESCGNGVLDWGEQCDDGANGDDLDGCRDSCFFSCQDPALDCPELPGDCHTFVCQGGGEGEICDQLPADDPPDDGNPCTDDLCVGGNADHPPRPDGIACEGEAPIPGQYCKEGLCVDPFCGDGVAGPLEPCDDGNEDECDGCRGDCSLYDNACNDGILCPGEECDDGNGDECDGCLSGCLLHENSCGDEILCPGEECDDGNEDECDGCLSDCFLHDNYCRDGITCPPEQCDDGNDLPDDGCTPDCDVENPPPCPDDMVQVPADPANGVPSAFCIDRYEASRQDATAESMGSDTSVARSVPDVIPWWENPISQAHVATFKAACEAAGKRLCEKHEWFYSCTGSSNSTYLWGNAWDASICNSVDSWCEDFCLQHGIDPVVTGNNCGYTLFYGYPQYDSPFFVLPTGSMENCVNEFGAMDINGNLWEVFPSATSPYGWTYEVRGGAFNCGNPSVRFKCSFVAGWTELYAGFRCCKESL